MPKVIIRPANDSNEVSLNCRGYSTPDITLRQRHKMLAFVFDLLLLFGAIFSEAPKPGLLNHQPQP
jgi:hypothetical protein